MLHGSSFFSDFDGLAMSSILNLELPFYLIINDFSTLNPFIAAKLTAKLESLYVNLHFSAFFRLALEN